MKYEELKQIMSKYMKWYCAYRFLQDSIISYLEWLRIKDTKRKSEMLCNDLRVARYLLESWKKSKALEQYKTVKDCIYFLNKIA